MVKRSILTDILILTDKFTILTHSCREVSLTNVVLIYDTKKIRIKHEFKRYLTRVVSKLLNNIVNVCLIPKYHRSRPHINKTCRHE